MQNIEIKTPLDDPGAIAARLQRLEAAPTWTRRQRDTFFRVNHGYLKLRVMTDEGQTTRAELIAYRRDPGSRPRPSDYDIAPVTDPDALERALTRSLGIRGVVTKTRRLFLWRHTRIHLDDVEGLGIYLELETVIRGITPEEAHEETETVINALGLDRSRFLDRPYLEMLESGTSTPGSPG